MLNLKLKLMKIFLKTCLFLLAFVLVAMSFNKDKKIVVIDAGHGGADNGAVYDQHSEKDIVLAVASKIKNQNKDQDLEIVLTREGDQYPSLSERSEYINKLNPDLVISLHLKKNTEKNTDKQGFEVYYSTLNEKSEQSKTAATELANLFNNAAVKDLNLHILRTSKSPAVIIELGFLNNDADREFITSTYGQNETAKKILDFLSK